MKKTFTVILFFVFCFSACSPTEQPVIVRPTKTETSPVITATVTQPPDTVPPPSATVTDTPLPVAPGSTPIANPTLPPGQPIQFAGLYMIDSTTGWAIESSGRIVRTRDGGLGWKDVTPPQGNYAAGGFFALDANTAWATSACNENCLANIQSIDIWHTTDGGITWRNSPLCLKGDCVHDPDAIAGYYIPKSVQFLDSNTGWLLVSVQQVMFQDRYRLYKTTDGGANWAYVADNITGPLAVSATGVAFIDKKNGWFATNQVGGPMDPAPNWYISKTIDGGRTWNQVDLPEPAPLPNDFPKFPYWCGTTKINAIPPKTIDLSFSCVVRQPNAPPPYIFHFHSSNGGESWQSWQDSGGTDFITELEGWRLTPKDNGAYNLEKTQDGGVQWEPVKTVRWMGSLDFVDEKVGWALASSSNVSAFLQTIDGGQSWNELKPKIVVPISPANAANIKKLKTWPTGMLNVSAFSPDWNFFAAERDYSALQVWQTKDRQREAFIPLRPCWLRSSDKVAFSPDGTLLAAGLCNATTQLLRVADGTLLQTFYGELVEGTPFSPDSSMLATTRYVGLEQVVEVWNVPKGSQAQVIAGELIDGIAFSPDGAILAFGAGTGLQLWRIADKKLLQTISTEDLTFSAVAFSPDGKLIATAEEQSGLKLWRVADGALLYTLDNSAYTTVTHKLVFSPDGTILLSTRYDDNERHVIMSLWQVDNGKLLKTITGLHNPFTFSPDGLFLATGSNAGILLWGIEGK